MPDEPGAYAFLVAPHVNPIRTLWEAHGETPTSICGLDLLYVGATADQLRLRIKQHIGNDTRVSTLRMSLGLLLRDSLELVVGAQIGKRYFWFRDEAALTAWIRQYTHIAFLTSGSPFDIERDLLRSHAGLLNVAGRRSAISLMLRRLRAEAVGRIPV